MAKPNGWRKEPARHALAALGVTTGRHHPVERTMPEYVDLPVSVNFPLSPDGRRWMYERMWPIMDQMDVVWDDIEAPMKDMAEKQYVEEERRFAETVVAIRELADRSTNVDELYAYEAEENLTELQRLSIVLEDHGRYIATHYPELRSKAFGGSLGEHTRNNAHYVKGVAEEMLHDIDKYKPRRR